MATIKDKEEILKKVGAKELIKSESGRKLLSDIQKEHWQECLQPSDKRFKKIYGEAKSK